jgi:hypothetical protein
MVNDICCPAGQAFGTTEVITGVGSPTWKFSELLVPKQVVNVRPWLPVLAFVAKE